MAIPRVIEAVVSEEIVPITVLLLPDVRLLWPTAGFAHDGAASRGEVSTDSKRVKCKTIKKHKQSHTYTHTHTHTHTTPASIMSAVNRWVILCQCRKECV